MIEVENEIYDSIVTMLEEKYPDIACYSETTLNPASFPAVYIQLADNYSDPRTMTSGGELYANIVFEINVYSNKYTGRKAEAKQIAKDIDEIFMSMGFKRTTFQPISLDGSTKYRFATTSSKSTTICRYFSRYEGTISADYKVHSRW